MKYIIIPVTPYQQNCSLLICEKTNKAALVDPGGDVDLILAALDKEQAELEKYFLLTDISTMLALLRNSPQCFLYPLKGRIMRINSG